MEAGLIDSDQARRIVEFEKGRSRPTLVYAIAGLAGLAVAVGVVSVVAANWGLVPGRLRIATAIVSLATLSGLILELDRRRLPWVRDVAILVHYGGVLAAIALVGQVYQLSGSTADALALWSLLTAPLMAFGQTAWLAFSWLMGLEETWSQWLFRWFGDDLTASHYWIGAVYWAPLAALAVGRAELVRRLRPTLARVWESLGWAQLILLASLGVQAFYVDTTELKTLEVGAGAAVSALVTLALLRSFSDSRADRSAAALLLACWVASYLMLVPQSGHLDLLSAVAFLALWLVVAWTAWLHHLASVVNLATAILGLRILAIYFEVFGSLLGTGIGLISGGILTMAMLWLWLRTRRDLAASLVEEVRQ